MQIVIPRQSLMRAMKPGDRFVFMGAKSHRQQVTTIVSRIGGKFTQEAANLVDQQGGWVIPVTIVTCEASADKPTGNRGRPRKPQANTGTPE